MKTSLEKPSFYTVIREFYDMLEVFLTILFNVGATGSQILTYFLEGASDCGFEFMVSNYTYQSLPVGPQFLEFVRTTTVKLSLAATIHKDFQQLMTQPDHTVSRFGTENWKCLARRICLAQIIMLIKY